MRNFWLGFGAAALLAAVVGGVLLAGGYDVAATEPHTRLGTWVLDTTRRNSVARRADERPPRAFDAADVRAGFVLYQEACVICHGAPGRGPDAWGRNMLPDPPALNVSARHWSPGEIHWMVKQGIKMSGMPAFGAEYSDAQIWQIVAFVEALPQLDREEYATLERELGATREAALEPGSAFGRSAPPPGR